MEIYKILYIILLFYLHQTSQIISIYSTGHLDSVISEEHRKEILRYLYNHQVHLFNFNIPNLTSC